MKPTAWLVQAKNLVSPSYKMPYTKFRNSSPLRLARWPRRCDDWAVPVLNEDTFTLMSLIEADDELYKRGVQLARREMGWSTRLLARWRTPRLASLVREDLVSQIRLVVADSHNDVIQSHLSRALVDWRDVAREFIADALSE